MHSLMMALFYSMILFTIGFLLFGFYAHVYSLKLYFYLKKEKYNRWCEITTLPFFGPGGTNPIRGIKYLRSNLDNEDETVHRYKTNIKLGLRQALFIFIALLVNSAILAVLIIRSN